MGVKWHESLSIGVAQIDAQHKELVSRFDRLLTACEAKEGIGALRQMLDFLDEYVVRHFRDEEELQRKNDYPEYELHRKQHESFKEQIRELKNIVEREGAATPHVIQANDILIKWLINHISESDTKIGKHLGRVGA